MSDFNFWKLGSQFSALIAGAPLNELGPGKPVAGVKQQLEALSASDALQAAFVPNQIVDHSMAQACLAGLWLRFDFLDESHHISQEFHNTTGSFWHGIMHRREPDFDNAKYWFRRVGLHPIFPSLCRAARELNSDPLEPATRFLKQQAEWDPFAFVDLVKSAAKKSSEVQSLCRQIQRREWELLFDFCFHAAIGKVTDD
jgi:hypothetical protein